MLPYEKWLGCIVDAARNIASREYQEEAWFPNGRFVSSPVEVAEVLIDDYTWDLFYEAHGKSFTTVQTQCWNDLRSRLEHYYEKIPKHPDPRRVLNDPEWDLVRQAAERFVRAFGGRE
jgi:hypothetical protein